MKQSPVQASLRATLRSAWRPRLAQLLALTLLLFGLAPADAMGQEGRRIEVLFLGHTAKHHVSEPAVTQLRYALAKEGFNFTYTVDPNDLNPRELSKYDALIIYANHDTITKPQEKALLDFVNSGHGFIPIHSASWCFQNSPAYIALVGGQFHTHKTGTFTADIIRPDHVAMQGLKPFETWDETYVHDHIADDITVLMERVEGDHHEPWTWVRTQGKGRVFYTAYGHDQRTWDQPAFHHLIENGIVWAVSDSVRAAWRRLNPPSLAYSPTSLIPNYERRDPPLELQAPLSPVESEALTQVPPGFELQLFAAEPDIVKPISMTWDERGRLWLAETVDYPNTIEPGAKGRDRIMILEDTDDDGKADRFTLFADSLNIPTGLVLSNGGVIVSQAPDFLFLKDTNGDDRADVKQVLVSGWGKQDTHAGPSNLRYGFDNRIWGAVGYSGFEGFIGGDSIDFSQAIYSFTPDGKEMRHVANFSNNTWGLGFSETFDIFGSTANNTHAVYVGIPLRFQTGVKGLRPRTGAEKIDGHYEMHTNTPNVRQVDVHGGFTAAAGMNLYTARSYPQEYWNRIGFVSEPTGRIIHRAILEGDGAGFVEKDGWNLLASADDWVGPVDAQVGPDGQVWVLDWYNFIIQHNPTPPGFENGEGNAYVNPLRDHTRGRIYRVVYKDAPAYTPITLRKDQPATLVAALRNDNLFWRMTAQRLLVERGERDVVPQLLALARNTSVDAQGLNSAALHALWTLQGLGALDGSNAAATAAAVAALKHPAAGVRKAAAQVLPPTADTRSRIVAAGLLEDRDPHTRLAAILAVSATPESAALGERLYRISQEAGVAADPWLSQAVYVAAAHHRPGFLKAQQAAVGTTAFRALAAKLAKEETTPREPTANGFRPPEPDAPVEPVATRLLRNYVEDVVGPIQRPEQPRFDRSRFGRNAEPDTTIALSVIKGQMKFSLAEFSVKAGDRVRVTLSNPDDMQHNFLVLRPGTREAVGALADAMARMPDGAANEYVPPTPDVMAFTKLADPGESVTVEFMAPREPGDYPFICSFPGHWRIMNGVMHVVQ